MYTKLFASILDSSIWREPDHVRLVWITLLAAKDRHGNVHMSMPGLADRARVTLENCKDAITRLSSPDTESQNPKADGRRIIIKRDPGGPNVIHVINSDHFRQAESDDSRKERHRRASAKYRARKRLERKRALPKAQTPASSRASSNVIQSDQSRSDQLTTKSSASRKKQQLSAPALAAEIFALITTNGQSRYIPKAQVEQLGPKALAAYDAVGGAERFLTTTTEKRSYLVNELRTILADQ